MIVRSCILTAFICLFFGSPLIGQSEEDHLSCATDELHQKLRATNSAYAKDLDKLEAAWSREAKKPTNQKTNPPPFVLPIVFHIVHENGAENIPNADIQRSLDFTNQAFANTGYYDQGTGSPTNIEFCLARRDPDNQPTNGINRIVSPLTDLNSNDDRDLKDLSRWEPRDYVNVWVVKEICGLGLGCGVAGYAYYPSAHGGRVDGIVVEARWLAGDEARVGVLIHELGHYLGLRHTFDGGCTNDDCTTDGDRVCDTPPDQSKVSVPCSGTSNSCTTDTDSGFATDQNDMFINYMDYGYFSCYSAFTAGQRDRMHFFLDGRRSSLQESLGCLDPCPAVVDANFSGGDVTVEAGTTLNFANLSSNGDSYEWTSNGTTFSTSFNASRLFDQVGTFIIRLTAESNDNLCLSDEFQQRVIVTCNVTAGFTPPDTLEVGRELLFTNTSSTQMNTRWEVDNISAGNTTDLVQTFDNPGLYTVCVEVDNGFCDDRFCRLIFVRDPPCTGPGCPGQGADTCTAAFVQSYISPDGDTDGTFTTVLPRKDGQYVGGRFFGSPMVLSLSENGVPLWQTELFPDGSEGTIIEMIVDGEGMLAGIGRTEERAGGTTNARNSFVFRIDPANGNLLWGRSFSFIEGADFRTILQPGMMEDYTLIGNHATPNSGTESGLFLRIDPTTGTITDTPKLFRTNGITFERAIYDSAAGLYQVVGDASVSSTSAGLLYVTLDLGGEVFSSGVLDNVTARGFFYDIIQDGDQLVAATDRFPAGINGFTTHLYKISQEGEVIWNRFYAEGNSPLPILDLSQNDIGYLVLARGVGATLVLIQTDRDGNVVWARRYSGVNFNNAIRSELMAVAGENIYLATQSGGQLPTLLRLEADGSSASDCVPDELIDVSSTSVQTQGNFLDISVIDLQLQGQRLFSEPFNLTMNGESCREPCEVISDGGSCESPLVIQWQGNEEGAFLTSLSSGNRIYSGGFTGNVPVINATTTDGVSLWNTTLELDGDRQRVTELVLDDQGFLYGIGSSEAQGSSSRSAFAFKLDTSDGSVVWASRYEDGGNSPRFNKIFLHPVTGQVHVFGQLFQQATPNVSAAVRGLSLRLNSLTGAPDGDGQLYGIQFSIAFIDGAYSAVDDTYLLVSLRPVTGLGNQVCITHVRASDGIILTNRVYTETNSFTSGLPSVSISPAGPVWSLGKAGTISGLFNGPLVVQLDASGAVSWAGFYAETLAGESIEAGPNGIFVAHRGSNEPDQKLSKINASGGLEWTFRYPDFTSQINNTHSITLTGESLTLNGSQNNQPAVLRLNLDGQGPASCSSAEQVQAPPREANIIVEEVTDNVRTRPFTQQNMMGKSLDLFVEASCREACEIEEICDNQIDDDGNGFVDCDDPVLINSCCCLDGPTLELGPDTLLCRGDTLRVAIDSSIVNYRWSNGDTTATTKITEPGRLWLTVTDSCGRMATDTLTLHLRQRPQLLLGPDTTLCSNAVIPLLAQDGFASYQWVDGSDEKSFTAYDAGSYWVIATDSCGGVQTDTVNVTIDPVTEIDLGPDTTICPGDTLLFSVDGFSNYQWSQSSFIDCTNCSEIRFAPTNDTLLLVAADAGPGCFSSDSIRIRMAPTAGRRDSLFICAGDSTIFAGDTLVTAGQYYVSDQSLACAITDTLDLFLLDTFYRLDTQYICAGSSTMLFGEIVSEAGIYSQTLPTFSGCDSTLAVELLIHPALEIELGQDTTICSGDTLTFSINGFASYEWSQSSFIDCSNCPEVRFAPTSDTLLFVAATAGSGCISSDSIRIRVAPTAGSRDSLFLCAGDSTIFAGDTLTATGQYYDTDQSLVCGLSDTLDLFLLDTFYRLDTQFICAGSSTMLFGELVSEAGFYSQTLPTINGCDSTLAVELLLRPTFESFDTVRICQGDSTLIFGTFEREANDFSRTFPNRFACDSMVNIRLEVSRIDISVQQIRSSCEGAAAGAAEVIISNGLPPYRVRWSSGDSSLRVEELSAGDYTVTVTDAAGCATASPLSIIASTSALLTLSPTSESCPGENDGSLRITGTRAGLTFSLDSLTFGPDSTLQNLAPGDYTLFVNDTSGCDQQLTFSIDPATGFFLDLPADQSIRFGDSLTLTPNTNLPAEVPILWLTSEGAGCPGCDDLTLRPLETVTVFASANGGNCPVADSTTITVVRGELFYVPNAFSPNGDGVNDDFRIFPGPGVEQILSFSVFDRWGGRVFLRENIDPTAALAGWDGTRESGGTVPQVGVYVYLVEVRLLNGEIVRKAGDVTVMR